LQYNGVKQQHLRYTATATAKATAAAAAIYGQEAGQDEGRLSLDVHCTIPAALCNYTATTAGIIICKFHVWVL